MASSLTNHPLVLSFLGSFQVTWEARPLPFASTASRALLAYLAIEAERPQPREQLAALLWPEQSQAAAYTNLRQTLARLRKALPDSPAVLLVSPQTLQFNRAAATLDVADFEELLAACATHAHAELARCPACLERLRRAEALHRDEFLQGLFLEHSQPFE